MNYRRLGKTGWEVSAISMGCWGIGGQWGPVSEKDALKTIEVARDKGINLFDTADAYGMGTSEFLVGKALKGRPDNIYIASKVGNWGRRVDDPPGLKSVYSIINCCHASLYRLGVDCIDLYQCHVATTKTPEIFVEAFEQLRQEGKIRYYGISTNDPTVLKAFNANGACATCQLDYSLLNRSPEADILPYCQDNDIGVLVRGPLAKGLLSGKFNKDSRFDDVPRQAWNDQQQDYFLNGLEKVEQLRTLTGKNRSLVDLALQFTLANPAVTCPIPGMKNPEQAIQNIEAGEGVFSEEDLARIDAIFPPGC